MNCGEISKTGYAFIEISKESWAPGIWAGVHDLFIEVRTKSGNLKGILCVTYCDLENRKVFHKVSEFPSFEIEDGDEVFFEPYVMQVNWYDEFKE
jgi:hypothetical protein